MKSRIVIVSLVVLGLVLALVVVYSMHNCQCDIAFSDPRHPTASYPIHRSVAEITPDVHMLINTGSSVSTISPDDVRRLREHGVKIDSAFFPAFGTDSEDNVVFNTKRYIVSLPAPSARVALTRSICRVDSMGPTPATIDNVTFLPGKPGRLSEIGMDILERFVVEFVPAASLLTLRKDVPEGYTKVASMRRHGTLATTLGAGKRYYVQATVDGNTQEYFLHSGIDRMLVKMPLEDTIYVHAPRIRSCLQVRECAVPVTISYGWMQMGNRAGERRITFSPFADNGEEHLLNPSTFFVSNVVFDFPNNEIYLRPHSYLSRVNKDVMAQIKGLER